MPCQQEEPHGARPQALPIGRCGPRTYFLSDDDSGARVARSSLDGRAARGRECAPQNEALRAFQPCPLSGKPDIEPTPPNDRV
jgi:hypothetical protein